MDLPLHTAIINQDIKSFNRIIDTEPHRVNDTDSYGYTPLHIVADRGFDGFILKLMDNGADPEARTKDAGKTPYNLACERGYISTCRTIRNLSSGVY